MFIIDIVWFLSEHHWVNSSGRPRPKLGTFLIFPIFLETKDLCLQDDKKSPMFIYSCEPRDEFH